MPLKLNDKQKEGLDLLCDPAFTRILFTGGVRSGKTVLLCEFLVQRCFQYPESRHLVVRNTLKSVKSSFFNDTLKTYLRTFIPRYDSNGQELYEISESNLSVTFYNGSQILMGALGDPEQVEKLLGTEYCTINAEEVVECNFKALMTVLTRLAQVCRDKDGNRCVNKLTASCNPRSKRHWAYWWFILKKDPESRKTLRNAQRHTHLHFTAWDNIDHLGQEFIDELDALPELTRQRMLLGEWINLEGLVFDEFDESIHVVPHFKPPPHFQKYGAVDYGYVHPFGYLQSFVDEDGRLYIYNEYKQDKKTVAENGAVVKAMNQDQFFTKILSDHDASARAELHQQGIYTHPAKKDVISSIDEIKKRLIIQGDGKPRLFIMDNCQELLNEMGTYAWKAQKDGSNAKEEVVKLDDDLIDPLRYICAELKSNHIPRMF